MKIFCSGIGGIGLSAYAGLQKELGHDVYGSDKEESDITRDLCSSGIHISSNQDGSALQSDINLFVYSEAIPTTHPERRKALKYGIPMKSYFSALADLTKGKTLIAVCGTHGKSTTTAMAAQVLIDAGRDPTVVCGTKVPDLSNRNYRKGDSDLFLVELCEYRGSFLHFCPDVVLLTTVDGDHFDYYEDTEKYQNAFCSFLKGMPENGKVVTHLSDPDCAHVIYASERNWCFDADLCALPSLSVAGKHNQENAQLVLGLSEIMGIADDDARESLKRFTGTWRRMELIGETIKGIPVIDDYAHHPREIMAVLSSVSDWYAERRIVCVFQPHMHDRTQKLFDAFASSFHDADVILVTPVYDARPDAEDGTVNLDALCSAIKGECFGEVVQCSSLHEGEKILLDSILMDGDVLIVCGAGDVTSLAQMMVKRATVPAEVVTI